MAAPHSSHPHDLEDENTPAIRNGLPGDNIALNFDASSAPSSQFARTLAEVPGYPSPSLSSSRFLPSFILAPHEFCPAEAPAVIPPPLELPLSTETADTALMTQAFHDHQLPIGLPLEPAPAFHPPGALSAPSFQQTSIPDTAVMSPLYNSTFLEEMQTLPSSLPANNSLVPLSYNQIPPKFTPLPSPTITRYGQQTCGPLRSQLISPEDARNAVPFSSSQSPNTLINRDSTSPERASPTPPQRPILSNHTSSSLIPPQNGAPNFHADNIEPKNGNRRILQILQPSYDIESDTAKTLLNPGFRSEVDPSSTASPLCQLHDAHVQKNSSSMEVNNQTQPLSVESHDQTAPVYHQRNPYIQSQVHQAIGFNPDFQSRPVIAESRQVLSGAITKPPRRRRVDIRHRTLTKVACPQCPELFETKVNADRHLRGCHREPKLPFPCGFCSASYEGKGARTIHQRKAHPDEVGELPPGSPEVKSVNGRLRYFCHIPGCKKNYTVINNLNRHIEMHHLNKRYPCVNCPYAATTRSNLKVHQRRMNH